MLKINKNELLGKTIILLYALIALLCLKADISTLMGVRVTYSDGVLFLLLDLILAVYCIGCLPMMSEMLFQLTVGIVGITIYQIFAILLSGRESTSLIIMRSVTWMLIYIFFLFYYERNPYCFETTTRLLTVVIILLSVFLAINETKIRNGMYLVGNGINIVYWVLLALPLAFFQHNKIFKWGTIGSIFMALFFSLKLTGFVAFLIPFLLMLTAEKYILSGKIAKNILLFVFLVFLVYVGLNIVINSSNSTVASDWINRMNYYSGSNSDVGRVMIWRNVLEQQSHADVFEWLFGHGYGGVESYIGYSAHNDFLEVLFDYGVIGMVLYLTMIIGMIKLLVLGLKLRIRAGIVMTGVVSQFFIMSATSHLIIYNKYLIIIALLMSISFTDIQYNVHLREETLNFE